MDDIWVAINGNYLVMNWVLLTDNVKNTAHELLRSDQDDNYSKQPIYNFSSYMFLAGLK